MFRPLYFFGKGASVAVQPASSLANLPVASNGDKTFTVDMKGWKYADGQSIDAESLAFDLNMFKSFTAPVDGKTPNIGDYCGYTPGYGIPDQIKSISYPDGLTGNKVVINFTSSQNPNWELYNELSQLQPLPNSWDATATGPSHCATDAYNSAAANTQCIDVYNYLNAQSLKVSTWTSGFWQGGDDGPFTLSAADALGNVSFVPNTKYAGPQKAQLAQVNEKAYSAESAEQEDLETNSIQIGYVDPSDLSSGAPKAGGLGKNLPSLAANYNLVTGETWSYNYEALVFSNNTSGTSKANDKVRNAEMGQLYVRQALQMGIDQSGIISSVDKNYAIPTCSPIPADVPASLAKPVNCAYPYSITKGLALLKSHGWKLVSGVATCEAAGSGMSDCGAGIPKGSMLAFKFSYLSAAASPATADTAQIEIGGWKKEGIEVQSDPTGYNTAITICTSVDICSWGVGWIYDPDFLPTGESILGTGAGGNSGFFSNNKMNTLIKGTDFGHTSLDTYGKYAAEDAPFLYVPTSTAITEVSKTLKGYVLNPLENFTPEYISLKK